MEQYVIGLDVGTGSAKAVAVGVKGNLIATSQFYYPTSNLGPGYSEQEPKLIWDAFLNCIKEIVVQLKRMPLSVSISSCMHSLIVVDRNHKAITPLITWADSRSEQIAEEIRKSPQAKNIYKETGTPIHSMSPLCKIMWLKENQPEIFSKAFKFISIKEFIWYRLFNDYQIDYSLASATGLFNIKNLEWNIPSLELCSISALHLSEIVSTSFIRKDLNPSIAARLQISADTDFCIGASDGCLANIGSYVMTSGTAALTIGTSGAVRIASKVPVVDYNTMIFNYVLDKDIFICGGPVNNGGNVLKWLFKTFLDNPDPSEDDYAELFKDIETIPPGCEGLLFLPYLYGERSPVWDEKSSALFFGIRSHHTRAHFFRAVIEGICFALKTILEIVEASTSPVSQLNVSGGFIHSKIWMQILADITGKKVCLIQTEDASSIGAALFYMKSIKMINDYSSINPGDNKTMITNTDNYQLYQKYYRVFKNLYQTLKESMHQLQKIN